jgi:signal transduction histidine kinase
LSSERTDRVRDSGVLECSDVRAASTRLAALSEIVDPELSKLGLASFTGELLSRAIAAIGADEGLLYLATDDHRRLSLQAIHGASARDRPAEIAVGDGMLGRVASTGRPAVVENIVANDAAAVDQARTRSVVAVALRSRGHLIGVLEVSDGRPRGFDLSEVDLVRTAADRLATAIDCARLSEGEQKARAAARDALQARDDFLSVASHELKTPMTSLVLLIECLVRSMPKLSSSDLQPRLESIEHQVMRLAHLTENLIEVSRLGAYGAGLDLGEVDLAAVARDVVARVLAETATLAPSISLHVGGPIIGFWDRRRCEQMIARLVASAAHGADEAHPIEIGVTAGAETARLTVRDPRSTHPPAAPDSMAPIRIPSTSNVPGLGVDWWIVGRIAGALGGRISIEDAPGDGSLLTVELPIRGPRAHTQPHAPTR